MYRSSPPGHLPLLRLCHSPPVASLEEEHIRLFADFDPVHDPEGCLRRYNAVVLALANLLDPAKREVAQARLASAEPLLRDFIADQAAAASTVIGDCETTELIEHGTAIGDMTISMASLLFVEDNGGEFMLSFWGDPSLGRGAPLRFFRHALDSARRLVFYNAKFDLTLAAGGDEAMIRRWWQKTLDPFKQLRDAFGYSVKLKLDTLLHDNGLAPKTGTGTEAVKMYRDGRYGELELYNRRDVEALRSLVELDRIQLSDGRSTKIGTLQVATTGRSGRYPPNDTRSLIQGSPEWLRARAGVLTASVAGAALGVNGAFRSRGSVAAALHAQLNGLPAPREDELSDSRRRAMERGQRLERVARRAYERLFGVRVEESGLHGHPRHPALAASPDGVVLNSNGELSDLLIEIKVPVRGTLGAGLTDAYLCQVQLTMACTETRRVDFLALRELGDPRGASTWQLAVTRVDLSWPLLDEMERQLVEFHAEAREDDQPYPRNSADAAELRMALLDTRAECVGIERVYEVADIIS